MKRQFLLSLFTALCMMTAYQANAQLSVGAGLAYGLDIEELGLQVRGVYDINETWRGEADFIYYFIDGDGLSAWELNLNGNYVFNRTETLTLYALAGINIFGITVDLGPFGDETATETGLNIGAGAQYAVSSALDIFGELKYSLSDADQLLIAAGILFSF